ncbi:MAG: alpha-2-macroglobulin family protein [Calditrichaceae bacterium]|nr:alpha-2-macroglobulin family protein [Calditrichaceae bacterium]
MKWMNVLLRGVFVFCLLISSFLITGCGETASDGEITYALETAKMVTGVTSGIMNSDGEIEVFFVANMVEEEQTELPLKKEVFSFKPAVEGITSWRDRRTLVFKPNQRLPFKQNYEGRLDLNVLFPKYAEKNLELLKFNFTVAGREVNALEGDFVLLKKDDPKLVKLEGHLSFSENTNLELLKNAAELKLNRKTIVLKWTEAEKNIRFRFVSEAITRTESDQKLVLTVEKEDLEISNDFEHTFILPAISDFKVVDIIVEAESTEPLIRVEFSDRLAEGQDISGFIRTEPYLKLDLKTLDKQVVVRGDFEHGAEYKLIVEKGLRSRWATALKTAFSEQVAFEDMLPEIRFSNDGVFLTTSNKKKVMFQTVNVKKVYLNVMKVFESNLGQFLQMEQIDGSKTRRDEFTYNIDRVGVSVFRDTLGIGTERNRWLQHELDLQKLIKTEEKGLYLISLNFNKDDMLYDISDKNLQYRRNRGNSYYDDPASYGYIYAHGKIYKPIVITDIGLVYKQAGQTRHIYATDLLSSKPMSGVKISLMTYQNQVIAEAVTDGQGMAEFRNIKDQVFYVLAEKSGQRSVIKPSEMSWNLSTFDTHGVEAGIKGVQAFIYTERGVYRPGDPVNISAIIRNENNTFPDNHPVSIKIINPKQQTVHEAVVKEAQDGFYNFPFKTEESDLTGNYRAIIKAGAQTFHHLLKIETVVPERLKLSFEPSEMEIGPDKKVLAFEIIAKYLFGNPASDLEAEIYVQLNSARKPFKKYSDFIFDNQTAQFEPVSHVVFNGNLNAEGKASIRWQLPDFSGVPGAISADINAKVFDQGGRYTQSGMKAAIDPYEFYVGIKRPRLKYWYAATGQELEAPVILLNRQGKEEAGHTLKYRIYKNNRYWWWEYDSREQYLLRYKKDYSTELIREGTLVSGNAPTMLKFTPETRGEYLIEVQDSDDDGHLAGFFIQASPWGSAPAAGKDAGILALTTDKEKYRPGDKAIISFPAPENASVLLTIEKGHQVLESNWQQADDKAGEIKLEIPITMEMLPTAYASVAVIQPHSQTDNDRPIRLYGVVPLNVEEASTHQALSIIMDDELKPKSPFKVRVQTLDKKPTQVTIAVVDEGLLSLTDFETPDPWKSFFKKQRLGVKTFDLFSHVIGVNRGDIYRTFSIGGGMAEDYRKKQMADEGKAKRFEPVCMFHGPVMTDNDGKADFDFNMPNYIGAVRVMAVSAIRNRYGHEEKLVPVKSDLMVMPTLPRVIGPMESFKLPVTVFAMKDNIGSVEISLKVSGPLQVDGADKFTKVFTKTGDEDIYFNIKTLNEVGVGKIQILAKSQNAKADYDKELLVRASSPTVTETIDKEIQPGQTVELTVPEIGMKGTNEASISINFRPNFNFDRRILWLIRYPYGCIEQTTSAVFPQLYIGEFIPKSRDAKRDISRNINDAIYRLRSFIIPGGGFAYWPGGSEASDWGTIYATHFLAEAKNLGYHVPQTMLDNVLDYLERQSREKDPNYLIQTYRLYVLSLAGREPVGALNILRENDLNKLGNAEKWMLAGSYSLIGSNQAAERIIASAGTETKDYNEFGGTYGSALRDKAIILEQMVRMKRWLQAKKIADELAIALSAQTWYSTQTTGYGLLALGKYMKAIEGDEKKTLMGQITLSGGKKVSFNVENKPFTYSLENGFGKLLRIELDKRTTTNIAFITLTSSGKPAQYYGETKAENLQLDLEFLDEDGMEINPVSMPQGSTFWAHIKVSRPAAYDAPIEEVALVQILPSGWEIENIRMNQANTLPNWMRSWRLNREEYLDIRDDRVMWFFDIHPYDNEMHFIIKINTVTEGSFLLPPTLLEAMYNQSYKAMIKGKDVKVTGE